MLPQKYRVTGVSGASLVLHSDRLKGSRRRAASRSSCLTRSRTLEKQTIGHTNGRLRARSRPALTAQAPQTPLRGLWTQRTVVARLYSFTDVRAGSQV